MPTVDPIAAELDRRYHHCCSPRQQRRLQERWQTYPALTGRSISTIRRVATTPGDDHNAVLADLLHASQNGDPDATTVLLAALTPLVLSDPVLTMSSDMIADRWAALGTLLAVTNPAEATTVEPRSFLKVLAGRMRRDAMRSYHRRTGRHTETHLPELFDRYPHDDRTTPVEDLALARVELAAIAAHLRGGAIPARRWRQLVDHRLGGDGDPASRSTVRRTSRRLAHIVGHAA